MADTKPAEKKAEAGASNATLVSSSVFTPSRFAALVTPFVVTTTTRARHLVETCQVTELGRDWRISFQDHAIVSHQDTRAGETTRRYASAVYHHWRRI